MNPRQSIRRHILVSLVVVVLLVGGLGTWAATSEFAGAVIAQGSLVVDTNVKKVQHPTGGVVAELRCATATWSVAGDVVIKLDDTQTRANLAIVTKGLDELAARRAREGGRASKAARKVDFPDELTTRKDDPEVGHVLRGEAKLFEIRRKTREGLKAQLVERVSQSEEEITGLIAQVASKDKQVEWIKKELEGVRELWAKAARFSSAASRRWNANKRGSRASVDSLSLRSRSPRARFPRPRSRSCRSTRTCAPRSARTSRRFAASRQN